MLRDTTRLNVRSISSSKFLLLRETFRKDFKKVNEQLNQEESIKESQIAKQDSHTNLSNLAVAKMRSFSSNDFTPWIDTVKRGPGEYSEIPSVKKKRALDLSTNHTEETNKGAKLIYLEEQHEIMGTEHVDSSQESTSSSNFVSKTKIPYDDRQDEFVAIFCKWYKSESWRIVEEDSCSCEFRDDETLFCV
jgi:hypothetical protein